MIPLVIDAIIKAFREKIAWAYPRGGSYEADLVLQQEVRAALTAEAIRRLRARYQGRPTLTEGMPQGWIHPDLEPLRQALEHGGSPKLRRLPLYYIPRPEL